MIQFLKQLSQKCAALAIIFVLSLAFVKIFPVSAPLAFFEAGQRDYWPPTVDGYSAQFNSDSIRFAPAFYFLGEGITSEITITNPASNGERTQTFYLYVSKVIESPRGRNIEDGTPNGPDIGDGELNSNEQAGNDIQNLLDTHTVGSFTFSAGGQRNISFTFTPSSPGYYQFDYSTLPPGNGYVYGHILAAGFVRVLPRGNTEPAPSPTATPVVTPSPTPTATPVATPIPSPIVTPTPTASPSVGRQSRVDIEKLSCDYGSFDAISYVTNNGKGVKDVKVTFNFNSNIKEATTNDRGYAQVSYSSSSNGTLTVDPEGYPGQTLTIIIPTNCSNGVGGTGTVSGSSSSNNNSSNGSNTNGNKPSILGATTLADTGANAAYQLLSFMAFGMILAGASAYGYHQTQKKA